MGSNKNRERARKLFAALRSGESNEFDDDYLNHISKKLLGALGEEIAAWYLDERGYQVIDRNYCCPEGEADIVALDQNSDEIVLVEVKTRRLHRGCACVYPEEAVTSKKRQRYRRIAYCYAAEHGPIPQIRFDVIGIGIEADSCMRAGTVHHICRAFDWEME